MIYMTRSLYTQMDYNEYAANMDMGQVFLEVMGRVCEEGFDFIAEELESWHIERLSKLLDDDLNRKPVISGHDDRSRSDHQIIVKLNSPDSEGSMREVIVNFSGKFFNAFSLAERVRFRL